jgi:hypothetical protein
MPVSVRDGACYRLIADAFPKGGGRATPIRQPGDPPAPLSRQTGREGGGRHGRDEEAIQRQSSGHRRIASWSLGLLDGSVPALLRAGCRVIHAKSHFPDPRAAVMQACRRSIITDTIFG